MPLLADLDRFELCGVRLRDAVDRLSFLGRSTSGDFDYPDKGLRLDVENASLEGFILALRDDAYLGPAPVPRTRAFAGRVRIRGRDRLPHELGAERDFLEAWGDPYWRDQDEDEILLFFEFDGREIQVELGLEGTPHVLVVTAEPLMSDPEQRARYGVTKSWPPFDEGHAR